MILDYQQGGLKMRNSRVFVKAQRIMWIKMVVTWTHATNGYLMGGNLQLLERCSEIRVTFFYHNFLKAWIDMNEYVKTEERYRGNEILNNNNFIQLEVKPYLRKICLKIYI